MQWLSTVVSFVAAFFFGMLARRSPKKDWEFVKAWPAFVLLIISGTTARMEYAQKQYERIMPRCEYTWIDGLLGCKPVAKKGNPVADLKADLGDLGKSMLLSMLLDGPTELLGIALGMRSLKQALDHPT